MDEIEDFREFWKQHKDSIQSLIKRKNIPHNARPSDIANMRFYQFIYTPIGKALFQIVQAPKFKAFSRIPDTSTG